MSFFQSSYKTWFQSLSFLAAGVFAGPVINEVAWMGSPTEGVDSRQEWRYEWVELYNQAGAPVSLDGWTLEFKRGKDSFLIPLSGTALAHSYLLVASSEKIPGADIIYGSLAGKLSNSGASILLKNEKGEVLEEVNAESGWFAGETQNKRTMERRFPERSAADPLNWADSQQSGGTPRQENSVFGQELREEPGPAPIEQRGASPSFPFLSIPPGFPLALLLGTVNALALIALRRRLRPSWWERQQGREKLTGQ